MTGKAERMACCAPCKAARDDGRDSVSRVHCATSGSCILSPNTRAYLLPNKRMQATTPQVCFREFRASARADSRLIIGAGRQHALSQG